MIYCYVACCARIEEEATIEQLRVRLLNIILAVIAAMTVAVMLAAFAAGTLPGMRSISMRYSSPPDNLYRAGASMLIGTAVTAAIRQRWPSAARVFFLWFLIIFALFADTPAEVAGGRSQFMLFIPLVMSSMLWRPWTAFAVAGVESVLSSIVEINMGHIPYFPLVFGLFLVATVCYTITSGLERKVLRLSQRDLLLRTAADVARIAASGRALDALLDEIANLICERFDLYYVGLFLIDETGQYAVLHTGTGEAGQQMVARKYHLEIGGASMIGQCIVQKKAIIAPDVQDANVRFDNPLLPGTRSEAAFPLLLGSSAQNGKSVIGAMTVQSDRVNAFDHNAQVALQAMADQTAVSIDSARTHARYREIVDIQSELIVRFRSDGAIVYANPAFCRFFDDNAPEGKHVLAVMGIQDEGWEHVYRVLVKAIPRVYEYQVFTRGQLRWMEFTSSVIEGGYQIVGRDVDDRITAQHSLVESEARYRALVQYAPTAVVLIDDQGKILDINDRTMEIYAASSRADVMKVNVLEFLPFIDADAATGFQKCLVNNKPVQYEGWFTSASGRRAYLQYHLAPVLLPSGQRTVLAHVIDRTENKILEEQVGQAQKMDALGKMAAGVAHDFTNYLAAIDGYAQLLSGSEENLAHLDNTVRNARKLVEQLTDFSRQQDKLEAIYLDDAIASIERRLHLFTGGVKLSIECERIGPILSSQVRIERVLMNLVTNARDAGARQIEIRATNIESEGRRCARLTVRDDGAGMDAETQAHIFEPFWTTKDEKGAGLGLSIVYNIVLQIGGQIKVYSAPGQGATFEIILPISGE